MKSAVTLCRWLALAALATVLIGCHRDMRNQPRYEALEASDFFGDGQSARLPVVGTVARGQLQEDETLYTGKSQGEFVVEPPVEITRELLVRGQDRYTIYCAPCHARTGLGNGMIVERGFRKPPSYHIDRLRNAPAGHFFDVMTHGFGAMPSYRRIEPRDRWAIVAYIRVLQLSQNATLEDVPESERGKLEMPLAEGQP
ncbi:MAG TPA: cytochrome c [Pirellulaceae bacterium]|nr:cytochrome c [Pirellulaceae bacterium]